VTEPPVRADGVRSDALQADEAAAALAMSMWPRFAGCASGGWSRQEPGVSAYCSGAPVWIFNGVIAASVRGDPALVAELLDEVAGAVSHFCLQVRPGAHGVEEVARARGMVVGEQEPLMLLEDRDRLASAASVDGLVIRRLRADEVNRHLAVVAEGFGAPVELFAAWASSDLLGSNDVYAYGGSVSGRDVATALGIVADDHVGVFNVAVAPDHRRRGYGAALSARTVLDGLAAGARRALLMSSETGLSVYQQLGFREIERWSYWVPPDAPDA
jgi:GNAT superfamily N-acetyltransferase